MPSTRPATIARAAPVALAAMLAAFAVGAAPARATVVLLSSSSGAPGPQDANLYDWRGEWTSALDRAAPVPGQRPAWQVDVGLWGDWYEPAGSNVLTPDPTCQLLFQIDGGPPATTFLNPCVERPARPGLGGATPSPLPEVLPANLAAASNGPHTVTITAVNEYGDKSSVSFGVDVDNVRPAPASMVGPVGWERGDAVVTSSATTSGPSGIAGQSCSIGAASASWYPGASARLVVAGNGEIPVRCTSQNNAAVSGPTVEDDVSLDNTPPTGYFAARDPSDPARATVVVADSLSGLAGGQIQIQTAGGLAGAGQRP